MADTNPTDIRHLGLSMPAANTLVRNGVNTLEQLRAMSDQAINMLPGMTRKQIASIRARVEGPEALIADMRSALIDCIELIQDHLDRDESGVMEAVCAAEDVLAKVGGLNAHD